MSHAILAGRGEALPHRSPGRARAAGERSCTTDADVPIIGTMSEVDPTLLTLAIIGISFVLMLVVVRGGRIFGKYKGATLELGGGTKVQRVKAGNDATIVAEGADVQVADIEAGRNAAITAGPNRPQQ